MVCVLLGLLNELFRFRIKTFLSAKLEVLVHILEMTDLKTFRNDALSCCFVNVILLKITKMLLYFSATIV